LQVLEVIYRFPPSAHGNRFRITASRVELFRGPAMAVATRIEFKSQFRRGNHSLVKEREKLPFHGLFNQTKFNEMLNIAFDVHAIMGVGDFDQFQRRARKLSSRHAAITMQKLGGPTAAESTSKFRRRSMALW
jgi:hypothetical protein